jgi:hypothetical protein
MKEKIELIKKKLWLWWYFDGQEEALEREKILGSKIKIVWSCKYVYVLGAEREYIISMRLLFLLRASWQQPWLRCSEHDDSDKNNFDSRIGYSILNLEWT